MRLYATQQMQTNQASTSDKRTAFGRFFVGGDPRKTGRFSLKRNPGVTPAKIKKAYITVSL
jgi:hypothetical protein